jgi:hypothetical protein
VIEWWGKLPRLRWPFYSSRGCELDGPRGGEGIACDGGVNSMLQFWLERGGNGTKRYRKMKQMQQSRLGLMGGKCDMTR